MASNPTQEEFKFNTPEGWSLCRKILTKRLPFRPHDYQLDGVTSLLDGQDLLVVSATGSGKTAYIYMLMHIILEMLEHPNPTFPIEFPSDPAILVISPMTALEEDQAIKMQTLGLTAQAVNSATKADAEMQDHENIWRSVETGINIILISPEMLSTSGFTYLVDSKKFQSRLYVIAVDEVHLLGTWGNTFRPAFHQIQFLRARFKKAVPVLGLTATLHENNIEPIHTQLGLKDGNYKFIRRSNARPDIQLIFRKLNVSSASERFPELEWVLKRPGKTLIFCSSIRFGFKLAVYLWHLNSVNGVPTGNQTIGLFNSLNSAEYNRQTLELLTGTENSKVTIAMDKLSVGVDVSDFQTMVIIDPKDIDDLWQKAGRVGWDRNKVKNPTVIVYFLSAIVTVIQKQNAMGARAAPKKKKRSHGRQEGSDGLIDSGLLRLFLSPCYPKEVNAQYDNPPFDPPCSLACMTCQASPPPPRNPLCNCSKCLPEPPIPTSASVKTRKSIMPLAIHVTKEMREIAQTQFVDFRKELWECADESSTGMVPMESYLPDPVIDDILDAFPTVLSKSNLLPLVKTDERVLMSDE